MDNEPNSKQEESKTNSILYPLLIGFLLSGCGVVCKLGSSFYFGPAVLVLCAPLVLIASAIISVLAYKALLKINVERELIYIILAIVAFLIGFIPLYWIAF